MFAAMCFLPQLRAQVIEQCNFAAAMRAIEHAVFLPQCIFCRNVFFAAAMHAVEHAMCFLPQLRAQVIEQCNFAAAVRAIEHAVSQQSVNFVGPFTMHPTEHTAAL